MRRSLRSVLALFDGEIELKLRAQALLVKLESCLREAEHLALAIDRKVADESLR